MQLAPSSARTVHHGDGLEFLRSAALGAGSAVITSLPDASELPRLGFFGWRDWFVDAAELVCRATADEAVAVFFQTDVKREGRWVDKAFLVQLGAERAGVSLLWHKVVCRAPAGVTTFGRPAYAHMLAFSRALRLDPGRSTPDVLPRLGAMTWSRAMGVAACESACTFVLEHTACRTVVDPFAGIGTVLAVANQLGLPAVGVELSRKRAERARTLQIDLTRSGGA